MVSEPEQGAPNSEDPGSEKRYKVLRLKPDPDNSRPDRGFGIWDNRHKMVVADEFETPEEAAIYVNEHLTSKTAPIAKLKTMNEISAADAQSYFMLLGISPVMDTRGRTDCLWPEYFPKDIEARDFLQCLDLYSRMYSDGSEYPFASKTPSTTSYTVEHYHISSEQRAALAEIASTISDADLDKKLPVGSREREVLDVLRQNLGISNQGIGDMLHISESTGKTDLLKAYDKLELEGGRGKYGPNTAHARRKPPVILKSAFNHP